MQYWYWIIRLFSKKTPTVFSGISLGMGRSKFAHVIRSEILDVPQVEHQAHIRMWAGLHYPQKAIEIGIGHIAESVQGFTALDHRVGHISGAFNVQGQLIGIYWTTLPTGWQSQEEVSALLQALAIRPEDIRQDRETHVAIIQRDDVTVTVRIIDIELDRFRIQYLGIRASR